MCNDGAPCAPYERGSYGSLRFRKVLPDYLKGTGRTDRKTFIRYLHLVVFEIFSIVLKFIALEDII